MACVVESILGEAVSCVNVIVLINESHFSGYEDYGEGGVLGGILVIGILEETVVVVQVELAAGDAQAAEVEEVDAASVSGGKVRCDVDAWKDVGVCFKTCVNRIVVPFTVHDDAVGGKGLEGVEILLCESIREGEGKGTASVVDGKTVRDDAGAVGKSRRCGTL